MGEANFYYFTCLKFSFAELTFFVRVKYIYNNGD